MDNSSRIRMLICDLMDKGELRMCSVIREKSGSLLLKVRVDEMNDQEDGCLGGVSLNSNIHFRRKSQKQFHHSVSSFPVSQRYWKGEIFQNKMADHESG